MLSSRSATPKHPGRKYGLALCGAECQCCEPSKASWRTWAGWLPGSLDASPWPARPGRQIAREEATMTLLRHEISTESAHQRPRHPRWRLWAVLAGVGGCLLSGAAGGAIVLAFHGAATPTASTVHRPASPAAGTGLTGALNATRLAAAVGPAVVNISTRLDALEGGGRAAGTGMIVSRNGEIVTNNHVVQGADTVAVSIRGHGTHPAAVIGADPAADIAVLRVTGLS